MRRLNSMRPAGLLAVLTAVALAATACSDSNNATPGGQAANTTAAAGTANSLKGSCPDKVVFQDGWWAQAENASVYHLLGENPTVDKAKKKVTGRLVASGVDTGVELEIRAGGPAINFQQAEALLYTDNSITIAAADVDHAAQVSATKPFLVVFGPLDLSPTVLLWDPKTYPQFNTINDIGQSTVKVAYFQGSTYMDYLTGAGILRKSQVDPSYQGSPDLFVGSKPKPGAIVQQGFLTNEVYSYEHEIPQWKKPVAYQLISDTGFPAYGPAFGIRPDRKAELTPCLKKLIPMLQRSQVEYVASPSATNDLIVQLVKDWNGFPYSKERADNAVKVMTETGVVGNGGNKTIGDFDMSRVQKLIEIVTPIFAGQKTPVKAGLKPEDIVTNEYTDASIGLPAS